MTNLNDMDPRKFTSPNSFLPLSEQMKGVSSAPETAVTHMDSSSIDPSAVTDPRHAPVCSTACSSQCPILNSNGKISTLEHVEAEIERYRVTYLLPLYRMKNTFLPISRLPWHTLTDIFSLCRIHEDESDLANSRTLSHITATCYAWRQAARSDGRLWTHINCAHHPELVNMYWQLAFPYPVSARLFDNDAQFPTSWEAIVSSSKFVLNNAARLRHLALNIPSESCPDERRDVMDAIDRPIMGLDHIEMMSISSDEDLDGFGDLPLLSQVPRSLKALKLCRVYMGSLSLQSWNLRELRMYYVTEKPVLLEPWRSVLLHLAPQLEVFILEEFSFATTLSSGPPILMRKLRHLSLSLETGDSVMSFLTNLKIEDPISAIIDVKVFRQPPDWCSLASFLNDHYENNTALSIHLSTHYCNRLSWSSLDSKSSFSISPLRHDRSTFDITDSTCREHSEAIKNLLNRLSLTLRLQVLELSILEKYKYVDGNIETSPPLWDFFNVALPNVSILAILSAPHLEPDVDLRDDDHDNDDRTPDTGDFYVPITTNFNDPRDARPRKLCSSLLARLAVDQDSQLFPALHTLHLGFTELPHTYSVGQKDLLAALSLRSTSRPIQKMILDSQSSISAGFRMNLAEVSPTIVVEMDGRIIPMPTLPRSGDFSERVVRGRQLIVDSDHRLGEAADEVQGFEIMNFERVIPFVEGWDY